MPVICPTCGAELHERSLICPKDGTKLRQDANEPPDPLVGRLLDGRYRVEGRLGSGGLGTVYVGEHVGIRKKVAIKVLQTVLGASEELRIRFEREARAASRLSHPACMSVLDFGHIGTTEPATGNESLLGMPYIVMELVQGETLYDRLRRAPKISPAEALTIMRGLLAALRHAHSLGIIHRDVKPANIMLASDGSTVPLVKLLDFGLAKDLRPDSDDALQPITQAGMVFGTPGYLTPEQAAGHAADARSDLYSAGVVLFEMLCGRPPFVREEAIEVVRDHLKTPPPRPRTLAPELSPELEAAVLKALEKDAVARFQSAEELQAALSACSDAGAAAPSQPSQPSGATLRQRDWLRGWGWSRGAALTGGALLLGLLGWALSMTTASRRAVSAPTPKAGPATPAVLNSASRRRLQLASDYQRKLWCGDAIEELEKALGDDPALRQNPQVVRIAIPCLRPKTQRRTIQFLVESVGRSATEELRLAASSDPSPEIRNAASHALERLR